MICSTTENRVNDLAGRLASHRLQGMARVWSGQIPTVPAGREPSANRGPMERRQTPNARLFEFMRRRRGSQEPDSGSPQASVFRRPAATGHSSGAFRHGR